MKVRQNIPGKGRNPGFCQPPYHWLSQPFWPSPQTSLKCSIPQNNRIRASDISDSRILSTKTSGWFLYALIQLFWSDPGAGVLGWQNWGHSTSHRNLNSPELEVTALDRSEVEGVSPEPDTWSEWAATALMTATDNHD